MLRDEHPHPGSLIHVDFKKVGNVHDQGGWRYVGRNRGDSNRVVSPGNPGSERQIQPVKAFDSTSSVNNSEGFFQL